MIARIFETLMYLKIKKLHTFSYAKLLQKTKMNKVKQIFFSIFSVEKMAEVSFIALDVTNYIPVAKVR